MHLNVNSGSLQERVRWRNGICTILHIGNHDACDEQWHETKRPLLLPPAPEKARHNSFVVITSVFEITYMKQPRGGEGLMLTFGTNVAHRLRLTNSNHVWLAM